MTTDFNAEGRPEADAACDCRVETIDVGSVVVTAEGELDMHTCGEFREALDAARLQEGRLIVDLSGVSFMDSTALSVLVILQRSMARPLDIVITQPHLRKLLVITGLTAVFTLHRTLDEARGKAA